MPRDRSHSEYGRTSSSSNRDYYSSASNAAVAVYDPEYDARNYSVHSRNHDKTRSSHREGGRRERSDREPVAVSARGEREYPRQSDVIEMPVEHDEYYGYMERKPKKRKHKRKHSKDRSLREKKKPKQKASLVPEYDIVSSESEVYAESIVSEHHSVHSPIRSRVTPELDTRRRSSRAISPGSAIKAYRDKHLYDNQNNDSPAAYREVSPQYVEQSRSGRSKSRRQASPEVQITKTTKSHRTDRLDAPKAYAYKRGDSPSPKRARHRSRTPSPYQITRRRSPSPQYVSSR